MKTGGVSRRVAWATAGLIAVLPLVAFFVPGQPLLPWTLVVGLAVLTAARPATGWLVLAAVSPFGQILGRLTDARWNLTEPLVLAFLAGWAWRQAARRRPVPPLPDTAAGPLRLAALFALAVVASLAVQLLVLQVSTAFPADFVRTIWRFLWHDYYLSPSDFRAIPGAVFLLEGVALFAATVALSLRHDRLARTGAQVFVTAAAVVAAVNLGAAVQQILVAAKAGSVPFAQMVALRVSFAFADVNAAGSYFLLALFAAGGLVVSSRHRVRLGWTAASGLLAIGLWLSGSRAAFLAAPLVSVFLVAIFALRGRRSAARIVLPVLLASAVLAGIYLAASPRTTAGYTQVAVRWRTEMSATALRMAQAYPVFGVGPGLFYSLSYDYSSPEWRASTPHENAHNNFLQVLAELGAVGLITFVALLGSLFATSFRQLTGRADAWWLGSAAGLLAFVLTWMTGHPLLTPEVALSFWLVLGLTAAGDLRSARRPVGRSRWLGRGLATGALLIVALVPVTARYRLAHADLSRDGRGFSQWHQEPDGTRFRWMFRRGVLYVPASAREVSIAFRSPGGIATVRVTVEGMPFVQLVTAREEWREETLQLPANYSWTSVPVAVSVRSFQPLPGEVGTPEERLQVRLPQVLR